MTRNSPHWKLRVQESPDVPPESPERSPPGSPPPAPLPTCASPSALSRLSLALICLCLQCPFVGSFMIQAVRLANELKEGLVLSAL